ncbi:MAG TPA: hypothetical protein VH349_05790 [Ktedonobacterales bacterium]
MPAPFSSEEIPDVVCQALAGHGITVVDEVALRIEVEKRLPAYTLYRLPPAASRRWKCKYRLMFGDTYLDCQTVSEAYARALLAIMMEV